MNPKDTPTNDVECAKAISQLPGAPTNGTYWGL